MSIRTSIAALALAATLASPGYAARRRAVSPPSPPSQVLMNVQASEQLRYTNLDVQPQTITTCLERTNHCLTDLLNPGQSTTRHPVTDLGQAQATLEFTTTGPAEIRGMYDAIPTSRMTTEPQAIPIMDQNQQLAIYGLGPARLDLLGSNGVQKDTTTIQANDTMTIPFTYQVGDQLVLTSTTPSIMTATANGVRYRAKTASEATGVQTLVKADNTTTGWIKNVFPSSMLYADSLHYAQNTANPTATYVKNFTALNLGTALLNNLTNGSTGTVTLQGQWVNQANTPFLAWSPGMMQTSDTAATAHNGFNSTNQPYNLSLNQVPDQIALSSDANLTLGGTITGYNDAGTSTGSMTFTLPSYGNQTQDLTTLKAAGATRITLSADNAPTGISGIPTILLQANVNGINKPGYQYSKPTPKVTGEQYMTKWLKPWMNTGFFLTYNETACLIDDAQCNGVTGFGQQLFHDLYSTSGYSGTETDFRDRLKVLVDADPTNGQLATSRKPGYVSIDDKGVKGSHYFCLVLAPNNNAYCLPFNDTNKTAVQTDLWNYEVTRADKIPTEYGGSTQAGPSPTFDPQFYNGLLH